MASAVVRSGIGAIDLVDHDTVEITNLNRQLIATHATLGMAKTEAMKKRITEITPECRVTVHELFYLPETADVIDLSVYDYIVDAIDNVTAKIALITRADALGIPVISCMGTGNKIHPEMLCVDDIYHTSVCPLARVMRRELKKCGIKRLKVVYSKEDTLHVAVPGSTAFVPAAAGLLMASEVIGDLTGRDA